MNTGTQGLIFVIDSNDRDRIEEARQELHRIIQDREMKDSLLLVFANKQDLPGAMNPTEVTEKLQLNKLKDRVWYVVPSCATTGEGLFEGLVSTVLLVDVTDTNAAHRAGFRRMSRPPLPLPASKPDRSRPSTHPASATRIMTSAFPSSPFRLF